MFSWDLMVPSRSLDFFGIEVEGWPNEAGAGPDSRMVLESFPFIFPIYDGGFFQKGHLGDDVLHTTYD